MHWGGMEAAEVIRRGWVVFTNSNTEESAEKFHCVSWPSWLWCHIISAHSSPARTPQMPPWMPARATWKLEVILRDSGSCQTVVAAKQWHWLKHNLKSLPVKLYHAVEKNWIARSHFFTFLLPLNWKKERDFSPEGESFIDVPESG